jgi:hypothetical protein
MFLNSRAKKMLIQRDNEIAPETDFSYSKPARIPFETPSINHKQNTGEQNSITDTIHFHTKTHARAQNKNAEENNFFDQDFETSQGKL